MKKVLFSATVDSHILHFHLPYLKMFKEEGYEVHVATNGDENIPYCDVKHKISFERSPFKLNNLNAIKQLRNVILREKFDIIHCHTPMGSVVTRIASKIARKQFGVRVIYTAHGFHFYKGASLINWLFFYSIEKYLSRYTDDLILINKEDYELALDKFKAKRIHYVPGVGVDSEKFDFSMTLVQKSEIRKKLNLQDKDIVLIYVAELNKNKNQIMAIYALQELLTKNKNYKLLLVGQDSYNRKYHNIVEKLGLSENIIFTGYRKDIPQLMKAADIAISTSLREGLPVNLIEASMCGLPIVATNCRGNRDIKDINSYTELIKIGDYKELANKVLKINHNLISDEKINTCECELTSIMKKMKNIYFSLSSSDKIRILHIIGSMNMGGAENFIMNLYRNIDREKIQFDFISHKAGIFDEEIKKMGGKVYYLDYINEVGPFLYKRQLNKFFKEHSEYKVLHSHVDQTSGIVLDVARKHNFKLMISHSHSTNNSNNFFVNVYKRYLQKKIIKYADIRLACSKEAGEWLYKKESFSIINNGININKYMYNEQDKKYIRNELNIPQDAFVLGHVGRFDKVKNHNFIIEIFSEVSKKNKNAYLVLVGDGKLKNQIIEKVNKFNLGDRVKFLGIRNDVNRVYSSMDCFIFPSIYEGVPVTLIEAQINGLNLYISENITNEVDISGNVKFLNINNISEWIENIDINSNVRNRINKDCIENYDIKNISTKYQMKIESEMKK